MAMGSGAFLVQVCRYLADRILEALELEGFFGSHQGTKARRKEDHSIFAPLLETTDPDERTILARRLVGERCLYGVDKNPMAVDLSKLSLWLATLAKDHPFT
ncbi:MAG: hypothetical protein KDE53_03515, partial [Caldilineaceae bacterium]|nr:hypothetical protein [Caldilineaceae bacterium]